MVMDGTWRGSGDLDMGNAGKGETAWQNFKLGRFDDFIPVRKPEGNSSLESKKRTSHESHLPRVLPLQAPGSHLRPRGQLLGAQLPRSHSKLCRAGLTAAPPSAPEPWGLGNTGVPASLFS